MHLLRHGQSLFNLHFTRTRRDPGIPDPALTEAGQAQARAAGVALQGAGITRILVSPYTRALQTAAGVAETLAVPVCLHPLVRERYAFTCDIGTPAAALAAAWPQHDFTGLAETWWPDRMETEAEVVTRAARFRAEMAADPEAATTLVVSHWGFLLALTGRSIENGTLARWHPTDPAPGRLVWA